MRENVKYQVDLIKFCATGGVFSKGTKVGQRQYTQEEMNAIVDEEYEFFGIVEYQPLRRKPVPVENFSLYIGNDKTITVFMRTPDSDVVNITGSTSLFTIKVDKDSPVLIQKSTANAVEGQLGNIADGEIQFFILPADTSLLNDGQYVYDVTFISPSGRRYTSLEGTINLKRTVA